EAKAAPRTPPVRGSGRARTDAFSDGLRPAGSLVRGLVRGERQERDVPRPPDGQGQLALVLGAGAEHPARQDLPPLRDEAGEELHVLVVHVVDLVRAELADLPAPEEVPLGLVLLVPRTAPAAGPAPGSPAASPSAAPPTAATEAHASTPSPSGGAGFGEVRPFRL